MANKVRSSEIHYVEAPSTIVAPPIHAANTIICFAHNMDNALPSTALADNKLNRLARIIV